MAEAGAREPLGFEEFFEHSRTGYVLMSMDGEIIRANAALAGWLGMDPASLPGKRFADCLAIAGKIYFETHLSPLLHMQGFFEEVSVELMGRCGVRLTRSW